MKKVRKQAGFTLAELLIVVAIIAILVAIGIPAFSTAMERSRETVDLSNIRGAYAEFMAGTLGGNANAGYYKVDIKQRDCEKWVIDCSGFLTNIIDKTSKKAPTTMPAGSANNLKTGVVWLYFYTDGTNEKPILEYAAASTTADAPTTTGKVPIDTPYSVSGATVTNGVVQSGDGWYLCKSGQ